MAAKRRAAKRRAPPPPAPKGQGYFLMAMMMMLFITVDPNLRTLLGKGMSLLLTPSIGFGGALPVISVALAGLLTGFVSTGLRTWSTDFVAVERFRTLQRAFSREMSDARRRRDVDRTRKLRDAQPYLMSHSMQVQMSTMKPAIGTMILAIAVFWWLAIFLAQDVRIQSISLPWAASWPIHATFGPFPYWIGLYSVMSLPATLALGAALKLWRYRAFDPNAPLKPLPSLEDLMRRAERKDEDEKLVEQELERAKRRLKKPRVVTGGPDDLPQTEDDVDIVQDEEAEIIEAEPGEVLIVEPEPVGKPAAKQAASDPPAKPLAPVAPDDDLEEDRTNYGDA